MKYKIYLINKHSDFALRATYSLKGQQLSY